MPRKKRRREGSSGGKLVKSPGDTLQSTSAGVAAVPSKNGGRVLCAATLALLWTFPCYRRVWKKDGESAEVAGVMQFTFIMFFVGITCSSGIM